MFKDRNFVSGCFFMAVIGVVLFGTMALAVAVHAERHRLSDPHRRLAAGGRGIGTFVAMILVGRLMRYIEARALILAGLPSPRCRCST